MMSILRDLEKVSIFHALGWFLVSASLICPPSLLLFITKRDIFFNLAISKLLILSISIAIPALVICIILEVVDRKRRKSEGEFDIGNMSNVAIDLMASFYSVIFFGYLSGLSTLKIIILLYGALSARLLFVILKEFEFFGGMNKIIANFLEASSSVFLLILTAFYILDLQGEYPLFLSFLAMASIALVLGFLYIIIYWLFTKLIPKNERSK